MKKKSVFLIVLAMAAVVGLLYLSLFRVPAEPVEKPVKEPVKVKTTRLAKDGQDLKARQDQFKTKVKANAKSLRSGVRPNIDLLAVRTDISEADRKLMQAIQGALDAENYEDLIAVLPQVRASANAEVREDFVDALGWFGQEGMLEMLPFIADRDEAVAESASGHWEMALNQVDDSRDKCMLVESAMSVIRDRDSLDTMAQELVSCDEVDALQTLINLIDGPNQAAAEIAREQYEFITDEKYSGVEAAEAWLQANYVTDDED